MNEDIGPIRDPASGEPSTDPLIAYLDREGVLAFADEGHRQRVIDGLAEARATPLALDVERLAEAIHNGHAEGNYEISVAECREMDRMWAESHAAEYARLAQKEPQ